VPWSHADKPDGPHVAAPPHDAKTMMTNEKAGNDEEMVSMVNTADYCCGSGRTTMASEAFSSAEKVPACGVVLDSLRTITYLPSLSDIRNC